MSDNTTNTAPTAPAQPGNDAGKKRYFEAPTDSPVNTLSEQAASEPVLTGAVKMIKLEDFTKVHLQPCARESFLTGMAAGFVVGGLRFVVGGNIARGCNWAVGTFVGTSLLSYEACMYKRRAEKEAMMRAAQIMEYKKKEIEARKAAEAAAKAKEEEAKAKPWYKPW